MGLDTHVGPVITEGPKDEYVTEIEQKNLQLLQQFCRSHFSTEYSEGRPEKDVSFGFGSYSNLHLLRGFAGRIEGHKPARLVEIGDGKHELQEVKEPRVSLKDFANPVYHGAVTRFPHIINHSDCEGFYLPVDFEFPVFFESGDELEGLVSVGSSVRLSSELKELAPELFETSGKTDVRSLALPNHYFREDRSDIGRAKDVWSKLYLLSEASIKQNLPIHFH